MRISLLLLTVLPIATPVKRRETCERRDRNERRPRQS